MESLPEEIGESVDGGIARVNRNLNHAVIVFSMISVFTTFGLSGCGNNPPNNSSSNTSSMNMNMSSTESLPNVKLSIQPKGDLKAGENVRILVFVSQNSRAVNDADMVDFEIWKNGVAMSAHQMFSAKKTGNGQYSIMHMFPTKGTYYVMYHVTARGSHVMEPQKVIVKS